MKRFNTEKLLNRVQCNRDTVLKKTRYRKENSYLAYYGYGWYKMGMTNNPQRREKELNIYHFGDVKILTSVKIEGEGVFTAEKELIKAFKDSGARGRDPLGQQTKNRRGLALAHYDALKKTMGKKSKNIIQETNQVDELEKEYNEYKEENGDN